MQVYGGCGVEMCVYRITQTHAYIVTDIQHPHLNTHDQMYIYIHEISWLEQWTVGYSAVIFAWMTVLSAEANVRACVRRYCLFVWLVASTYVCYVTEANVRACVRTSVWCGVVGWVEFICMCVYLCVQLLSCPPRPTYVRACMRACVPT